MEINITDKDIQYAENILFGKTGVFDDKRKEFIKNLDTIDLQAVPGSGKTTALLAKLLILEKYLPLKDNRSILVISHTNAAIDEIKNRIGKYCTKLFSYPNFVGTIQSFVDTFLAIPYYTLYYNKKPYRIDNEIYDEKVENILSKRWLLKYGLSNNYMKIINHLKYAHRTLFFNIRFDINNNGNLILIKALNSENLDIKKPRTKNKKYQDYSEKDKRILLDWFFKFKKDLLQLGYLHYDDTYFLAKCYLKKFPQIKNILQKRFKYVFVDEMQDMDKHQYELLENLFYDEGNSLSIFQRIGDKNQAIFNKIKLEEIWKDRDEILYLQDSHRLNPRIAPIVGKLALTPNNIVGLNTDADIKPHIIVFDNNTITQVIPKFAEIIKNLQKDGKLPKNPKHKFMAIAWRKEQVDENKLGLSSYWQEFSIVEHKKQIDYKGLKDYLLFFDKEKKMFEAIRKSILNALLKIMRLENIVDEKGLNYTKRKLIKFLKENFPDKYDKFKLNIYQWSIGVLKGEINDVFESIKNYIPEFLKMFKKEISNSNDFINNSNSSETTTVDAVKQSNVYKDNGIEIEIGTIHSAKGQTHTATLYLETYYYGKYEAEYLREVLLGNDFTHSQDHQKEAARMAYVGFSRPTHLLCLAIHKNRISPLISNEWIVIT